MDQEFTIARKRGSSIVKSKQNFENLKTNIEKREMAKSKGKSKEELNAEVDRRAELFPAKQGSSPKSKRRLETETPSP